MLQSRIKEATTLTLHQIRSFFRRDCESVLTKFNKNACIEKDRTDSKLRSHWPILL